MIGKRFIISCALSIIATLVFGQVKTEYVKIDWPNEYNWKVGSDQENSSTHLIELVPAKENIDKWKIMGSMLSYKGVKNVPINSVPDMMYKEAQKRATNPKLTIFEKDDQTKSPWVIFKIETAAFTENPQPESQLFYIIQGETALYINMVAVKEKELSNDFVNKWIKVFKASELVYK